jgi:hypothetical protein
MKRKQRRHAKKSGRATTDARGNTLWEWETDTGSFTGYIDTQELNRLQKAGLSVGETIKKRLGIDPYNNDTAVKPTQPEGTVTKPPRKSIDDLRKLSEEIRQKRPLRKHKK